MKCKVWDNPNKMHFESDFSLFNKQTNLISHGNVFSTTQTSFCVRPYNDTKNGGHIAKPGDFLRYDLSMFSRFQIPHRIRAILEDKNREETYFLYNFHVWKQGGADTIGWVITDGNDKLIDFCVVCGYKQNYAKRQSALMECIEYICT